MTEEPTTTRNNPDNPDPGPGNIIGEFITIIGEVTGKENIVIEGHIEGNLSFPNCQITVGKKARVNANIIAREIVIEGEVKGDMQASELANIKPSGRVNGNIRAVQVVLSQGCQFKGSVDMAETPHTHTLTENRNPKPKLTDNKLAGSKRLAPGSDAGNTRKSPDVQSKTFAIPRKKEP